MDAKSKANFINSVAKGETVVCPRCNSANTPDSKYCVSCGTDLSTPADTNHALAFASVSEAQQPSEQFKATSESVFAHGLPSWDIVPPQIMVRRR